MVADKSFGRSFLDDLGATYVHVLYFKRFGGPPNGKTVLFVWWYFLEIDPCNCLVHLHADSGQCTSCYIDLYKVTHIVIFV